MIYTLDQHEVDFWNHAGNTFGSSLGAVVREVAGGLSGMTDSTPNMVSIRENQLTRFAFNGLLAATETNTIFAHTTTIKATQERLLLIGGVLHAQLFAAVSARIEERQNTGVVSLAEVVQLRREVKNTASEVEEFLQQIRQAQQV